MRRQLGFCVLLVAGAAVVLGAASAGVKVAPDPENVVGSRLAGTWETDADLWTRLAGAKVHIPLWSFRFEADESLAAGLPARYADFLKDKPIYLAGRISGGHLREACPFILTVLHGNPHVVYFREKDGDPMGDAESFNVMLARGDKPENDILFIGGDFNNQPFTAYRRVAEPRLAQ